MFSYLRQILVRGFHPITLPLSLTASTAPTNSVRMRGGWGIGLTIVKQLVEAHGGKVWAESQLGQGTTIGFTLPS